LIIDDNESIHRDFRAILGERSDTSELDQLEASIFGAAPAANAIDERPTYELTFARQGEEALEKVRQAKGNSPYALAFVDMRMPPGWDGVETLCRLWKEQPSLQAVICSAYTDHSWEEITKRLGQTDRLLILKKPFDPIEVRQLAYALCEKWNQHADVAKAARRLSAQYAVTKNLMEAKSLRKAGAKLIQVISEAFDWPSGALWIADEETGEMCRECGWGAVRGEPGGGGERREGAGAAAGRETFAGGPPLLRFPITAGGTPAGALEFDSGGADTPDPGLLDLMADLCSKIGHFIERERVEAALRRSEAKNRALLDAIPDTILRIGEDGAMLDVKASRSRAPCIEARFAVGLNVRDALPSEVAGRIMLCVERAQKEGTAEGFDYHQADRSSEIEVRVVGAGDGEAIVILRDITEKKRTEKAAQEQVARDEMLRAQADALSALSAPLIPITDDVVVMPLIGEMDAARMRKVQEALIEGIAARRARVAILDITGVPSLDAQGTDEIVRIARAARLLGSRIILTGIRPEVAQALVSLGQDLSGVATKHSLQSGIAYALKRGEV
jgi:anti-anti-sigma factor